VCVHGSVSVCPCFCVCPCQRLCVSMCAPVCVSVCVPVRVSLCPCVSVSMYYNDGNFWEILRSANPNGSKKELRVISSATYGLYVLQMLLLMVSTCYKFCYLLFLRVIHFCYLRFHSICTPVYTRFQR
jgi:hypothetical protein